MVIFSFGLYQLSVAKKIFLTSPVLTAGGQNFKIRKIRRSHTLILPRRASKYMLAQYKWQKWIPDVKKHTFEKKSLSKSLHQLWNWIFTAVRTFGHLPGHQGHHFAPRTSKLHRSARKVHNYNLCELEGSKCSRSWDLRGAWSAPPRGFRLSQNPGVLRVNIQ